MACVPPTTLIEANLLIDNGIGYLIIDGLLGKITVRDDITVRDGIAPTKLAPRWHRRGEAGDRGPTSSTRCLRHLSGRRLEHATLQ